MARTWDTRSPREQAARRDAALADQFAHALGPFSPWYRDLLRRSGLGPRDLTDATALRLLPASTERDVCPDGDPAGAARLVLQADEVGWALHSTGDGFRHGLLSRLRGGAGYRHAVEAATRPTTFQYGGTGLTYPVASTRGDLDLVARAGARMWSVLGLGPADVLVSAVPVGQRLEHVALGYAALGAGAPALFPGEDPDAVAEALSLVPATVLAVAAGSAEPVLAELADLDALPETLSTVLLVGGPDDGQRAAAAELAPGRRVLGVWGPADGRVLYAEQVAGDGYVTYPDLEVWELVDPDTGGDPADGARDGGELTLTQLGFRGSALARWRTGATVDQPIATEPARGRTVPRIPSRLSPSALVPVVELDGVDRAVDLRALSSALAARDDLAAFRVDLATSARTGQDQLLLVIAARPGADPARAATGVAVDARRVTGARPSQVVLDASLA